MIRSINIINQDNASQVLDELSKSLTSEKKVCKTCGKEKPISEFSKGIFYKKTNTQYYQSDCKACKKTKEEHWRKQNPNYAHEQYLSKNLNRKRSQKFDPANPPETHICKVHGEQPISDYYIYPSSRGYIQVVCKACDKAYKQSWYDKNSDKAKQRSKIWHKANPEKNRQNVKDWHKRKREEKGTTKQQIDFRISAMRKIRVIIKNSLITVPPELKTTVFVCSKCGCVDSAMLGWWSDRHVFALKLPDSMSMYEEGKGLCSQCLPASARIGSDAKPHAAGLKGGVWHNRFPKLTYKQFWESYGHLYKRNSDKEFSYIEKDMLYDTN